MKVALEYRRISKEDQSNFSLSGQDKINREYAEKHGIQIIKSYVDDGVSAKNFDRPEWKKLEAHLSRNRGSIDYLIVSKYDRLIRNAAEGLAFIEKLEERWNIKLLSVMENFFIDPHSPFFFKMRADMLVNAEFERRVIADRTKFGVWAARSQGRFLGKAPFGYLNARDAEDKPIIIVDEQKRALVKKIFDDYLSDIPFPQIISRVRESGFYLKGHDALKRLLTNPVYIGMVAVRAYKDNISKTVKGIHPAIISQDVFWKANEKLNGKIKPQGRAVDENIPLRGYLLCEQCGHPHTGAKSKGKLSYYYYYWCKKCLKAPLHSAKKLHDDLTKILNLLSLDQRTLDAIKEEALIQFDRSLKERKNASEIILNQYTQVKTKLNSLEEKYIANNIEQEVYQKWHTIYSTDLNKKNAKLEELNRDNDDTYALFDKELYFLSDVNWIYRTCDVTGKQMLLKDIFTGYLTREKNIYRTPGINKLFLPNLHKTEGLLLIKETGNPGFVPRFPVSSGNGNEVEHLLRVISKVLKAA